MKYRSRRPTCRWGTEGGRPGWAHRRYSAQRDRRQCDGRKRRDGLVLRQDPIEERLLPAGLSDSVSPAGSRGSGRRGRQRPPDSAVAFGGVARRRFRPDPTAAQSRRLRLAPQQGRQRFRLFPPSHRPLSMCHRSHNHGRLTRPHHGQPARSLQGSGTALHAPSRTVHPRPRTCFRPAQVPPIALLEAAATVALRRLDCYSPTFVAGQELGEGTTAAGPSTVHPTLPHHGRLIKPLGNNKKIINFLINFCIVFSFFLFLSPPACTDMNVVNSRMKIKKECVFHVS